MHLLTPGETAASTPAAMRVSPGAWSLPLRAFLLSLVATLLVWGRFLLPGVTLSPEAQVRGINPTCRVGTAQLTCQSSYAPVQMMDAGAPAWVTIPENYYFRRARLHGEPRPQWNPYVGSGYPVALDGHSSALSPTQWFQSRVPGDQGLDIVVFARFLLWTFGLVWAAGLCGVGTPLLAGVAAAAVLAPYPASFVDIVFLDVDLLGPWFLLALLAFMQGRVSLRVGAGLCLGLGVLAGALSFLQSELALCVAAGVLALAAAPATRGRSLLLAAALGLGVLAVYPSWLPILRNLDQFVTSRDVQCVVERAPGAAFLWQNLILRPPHSGFYVMTATLVGAGLLLSVPGRWRFAVATLLVIGAWQVLGLPHAACSLPLVAGARFGRHLQPHFQMLFIFAVAVAIQMLSDRLHRKWPWVVFLAALAVTVVLVTGAEQAPSRARVLACCVVAASLGILAALSRRRSAAPVLMRQGSFAVALSLLAFAPFLFGSRMAEAIMTGAPAARQIAPLPVDIDPSTPLGTVQRLSRSEDRRHFSPGGFLYPNWSAALGVLDMLSLNALFPIGYYELNGGLFTGWLASAEHGLVPDRFVGVPRKRVMSPEFQRVMVLNRVSLLTFQAGRTFFAQHGGPYEESACQLVARDEPADDDLLDVVSQPKGAEAYRCPAVGGVGYFPAVVRVVKSRGEALEILGRASPAELVNLALLGPELDLFIAGAAPADAVAAAGMGRVLSVNRQGDDLSYLLEVDRAGVFVIADTYFRGWTATVDGRPAGISRANVAFKAVRVPAGRVELKLHFAVTGWLGPSAQSGR